MIEHRLNGPVHVRIAGAQHLLELRHQAGDCVAVKDREEALEEKRSSFHVGRSLVAGFPRQGDLLACVFLAVDHHEHARQVRVRRGNFKLIRQNSAEKFFSDAEIAAQVELERALPACPWAWRP